MNIISYQGNANQKSKNKTKWDTPSHSLGWLKSKLGETALLTRMGRNWSTHSLLLRLWNDAATVEKRLAVPQKVKQELTQDPAILLLDAYPKELKTSIQANARTWAFITDPFATAKVEITQMSICGGMGKQKYNRILFSHKTNGVVIDAATWLNSENILSSERTTSQKVTYDMIPFTCVFVCSGCVTKCHRLRGFNSRNELDELGGNKERSSRSRHQKIWFLVRSLIRACRWLASSCVCSWIFLFVWPGGRGSPVALPLCIRKAVLWD